MDFSAIIAEYNPFTNGHYYHIQQTKEKLGLPIICIMSGNFVQRGDVSVLNKYTRAKHAIKAGADIVIELPTVFALSPAPDFAYGAIKTLNSLGCIKYLSFGSESGNIEKLTEVAKKLINQEKTHNFKLATKLGKNYASSVLDSIEPEVAEIIKKPNNILAVEYIKALINTNSKIIPVTINREDNFNNQSIENTTRPSASAIRKLIYENKMSDLKKFTPEFTLEDINQVDKKHFVFFKNYLPFSLKHKEIKLIKKISEVEEGLEYRIKDSAVNSSTYEDFTKKSYTKRYKNSKIDRIVIKTALDITKQDVEHAKKIKPYIKVLAINSNKKDYIKEFNHKNISLIMKKKDYTKLNKKQTAIIKKDLFASDLSSICHKTNSNLDYTIGTLVVK